MKSSVHSFISEDAGAITVDWVVITSIAVALALLVMSIFGDVADGRTGVIQSGLATQVN